MVIIYKVIANACQAFISHYSVIYEKKFQILRKI